MQLKSILNSVEKHKGFVYRDIKWDTAATDKTLLVHVAHRKGSRGYCSGCGTRGRTYDTLDSRRFQFVPLWNILVFFVYAMRRIDCKFCGPTVEMVPWAEGKKRITKSFEWFLAGWAKRLVWKDVAGAFSPSWDTVFAPLRWPLTGAGLALILRVLPRSVLTRYIGAKAMRKENL